MIYLGYEIHLQSFTRIRPFVVELCRNWMKMSTLYYGAFFIGFLFPNIFYLDYKIDLQSFVRIHPARWSSGLWPLSSHHMTDQVTDHVIYKSKFILDSFIFWVFPARFLRRLAAIVNIFPRSRVSFCVLFGFNQVRFFKWLLLLLTFSHGHVISQQIS